jgi:nucleotide-binding universal stress UspA family protein
MALYALQRLRVGAGLSPAAQASGQSYRPGKLGRGGGAACLQSGEGNLMDYRTILVELGSDAGCAARIRMAADLASCFGAHVIGASATGLRIDPVRGAGDDAARYAELARRRLLGQVASHGELLGNTLADTAPGITFSHHVVEEETGWVLAQEARVADIVLLAQPGATGSGVPSLAAEVAEYVMLNAGRPVIVLPAEVRRLHGGHVVIAWDGQREAARAVADAMPLLLRARQVTILAVWGRPGTPDANSEPVAGLRHYLQRHGIVAAVRTEQTSLPVGPVICDVLGELGADFLVAGGYGHSRMRELVLGGTTRTLMRQTKVPVLFSH